MVMQSPKNRPSGFSLLELMIVIAVIAITIAWAIPSYQDSVRKARRADAQSKLREFEVCAARSYTVNSDYLSVDECLSEELDDGYYTFTSAGDALSFTVTATPQGGQTADMCGTMTLTQTGRVTAAAVGCWMSNQVSGS